MLIVFSLSLSPFLDILYSDYHLGFFIFTSSKCIVILSAVSNMYLIQNSTLLSFHVYLMFFEKIYEF